MARSDRDTLMDPGVVVLVIICEGVRKVSLHTTEAEAWRQLMAFVDQRWERRFGRAPSPIEPQERANQFFRNESDDLYAIIDADLSELHEALA